MILILIFLNLFETYSSGTLTVEAIYKDRDQFAALVREVATPDVGRMGIEIVSFTIKDIHDSVEYLSSLGKSRAAEVRRDAEVGVAQSERDAGIKESEYNRESMDAKYGANTKIEDAHRLYSLEKARYDGEVIYNLDDFIILSIFHLNCQQFNLKIDSNI